VVRHGSAKAAFVGSIPTLASNYLPPFYLQGLVDAGKGMDHEDTEIQRGRLKELSVSLMARSV
jgi:hypothetical protein